MWKPNDVVPQHKTRARFIWAGLLFSIFAYTIWQIVEIALERQNPTTSLTMSNDFYGFPYLQVCMAQSYGCSFEDASDCASTALEILAQVDYNGQTVDGVQIEGVEDCVDFDMTNFETGDGAKDGDWATATLQMAWVSSVAASLDTSYTESVGVFLGASINELDEFTLVPYSRVLVTDEDFNYLNTAMTIGKTVRKNIAGDKSTSYPVLTLSTTGISVQNTITTATDSTADGAFGIMYLDITQGSFSLSNIKENDPLQIGTLLGNIGGFWELLIIVWGLCFIATTHQSEPTLKARNFSKSIQQGTEIVTRRRSLSETASTRSESREARPQWEAAYRASTDTSMQSHHQQISLSNASHKRPVTVAVPQRNGAPAMSFGGPPNAADGGPPSYAQSQQG